MRHQFVSICLLSIAAKVCSATPVVLHIDNTHSSIQFSVPFFGVSEVTGRFERFCGQFYLDETTMEASTIELFIDASSINTGLKIRDRDLVEKYLVSKDYPLIHYKSKSVRLIRRNQFDVIGDLRLHGVTKEMRITLVTIGDIINSDNARELGLKLEPLRINRTDHGIMEGAFGSSSVGDTVTVSAVIRVRDVTPYRKDVDAQYPEKNSHLSIPFAGSFVSDSRSRIDLIADGGNYFLSFSDEDWSWFAQARMVGPRLFKLLSFGDLVELTADALIYTKPDAEPERFTKLVKK